jgi:putative ATPase
VFTLELLSPEQVETIIGRALADPQRGIAEMNVDLEDDALKYLVDMANGDARTALNALETAAYATNPGDDGRRKVDLDTVADAMQRRSPRYDKGGDGHYDTISAFIKSVRGSSPDGALYWLARMIDAGEDALFIARRLVVLAAEDIGLAQPGALAVAMAAQQAVHFLGMPEGRIPLAEATVYLATSPKSNSAYAAINRALEDARHHTNEPVPLHLRNAVTGLMKEAGYGEGYKYAHDYEGHFVEQEFLPPSLKGRRYYQPSQEGAEKQIGERLKKWWGASRESEQESEQHGESNG